MKKLKPVNELVVNSVLAVVLGVACIVGGLIARNASTDIRQMFASGHWSVAAVGEKLGVRASTDLETENERLLFRALGNAIDQCVGLAGLCVDVSNAFLLIGACLCVFGGRGAVLANRVKRNSHSQVS